MAGLITEPKMVDAAGNQPKRMPVRRNPVFSPTTVPHGE